MTSRLAIYSPNGRLSVGGNVFGKDIANFELFKAMVQHGGLDQVDFLTHTPVTGDEVAQSLLGDDRGSTKVTAANIMAQDVARDAGVVLRGAPRLDELAWQRRRTVGDRAYSLMGLIHTIAPLAIRQEIATAAVAPTHPWDALICTSPAVQRAMRTMFSEWTEYLADRFGGKTRPQPLLPLIPLGVDATALGADADRPQVRAETRKTLDIDADDILILWVGRLSFFEKAFPQSMMRAAEEAAQATGKRVHFAMVGWFPGGADDERRYRQAADAHSPSIAFHVVDGNDRQRLSAMWSAADIFVSLVDNIQETFGITPLEAMASGLPVVVSDWDGYRYTVRDGEEGFLIPTLGGPEGGLVQDLVGEHALGLKSYQQYVGIVAQHTAVHVGRAALALAQLIQSPDLRRKMGEAGRRRIRETFDWSVVAPQYTALATELTAIRQALTTAPARSRLHPVKGDPFRDFAGFATTTLSLETKLRLREGITSHDVERVRTIELDMFAANWRGTIEEALQIVALLEAGERTVQDLLMSFPKFRRRHVQFSLAWMAKEGFLDWL